MKTERSQRSQRRIATAGGAENVVVAVRAVANAVGCSVVQAVCIYIDCDEARRRILMVRNMLSQQNSKTNLPSQ